MRSTLFTEDHDDYRETVRAFLGREVVPHYAAWEDDGLVPREVWQTAGKTGVIGLSVPGRYGGTGEPDYRYRVVVAEEVAAAGAISLGAGLGVQDDIVIPYVRDLGTEEQKRRWLPGLARGELIGAIAMTEPGAGSDLRGVRTTADPVDGGWSLRGAKTFISNGINADLVIVFARTDPDAGSKGFSLLIVERGAPGFDRGRRLRKVGLRAQDTAELSFDDVRVPAGNVLGEVGGGFGHVLRMLPRERLSVAVQALAGAAAAFAITRDYCFERRAFGGPIGDLQHVRFVLAELATELDVARSYIERAVLELNRGELDAVDAAKAKWWATELQNRVVDRCVQLHGGYGYMLEHPIARAFIDSRVQTIYGGTTEIMKEIIGRDLARARPETARSGSHR
jgi:alkylation response protein AidB-like acyl-CoA dehydrogenase